MLMHHFRHNLMSQAQTKRLNRMVYKFLWSGPDKVKRTIIRKKLKDGGLNIIEPHKINYAVLSSWLQSIDTETEEDSDLWKRELKHTLHKMGSVAALNKKPKDIWFPNGTSHAAKMICTALAELVSYSESEEYCWDNPSLSGAKYKDSRLAKKGYCLIGHFIDTDGRTIPPRSCTTQCNRET